MLVADTQTSRLVKFMPAHEKANTSETQRIWPKPRHLNLLEVRVPRRIVVYGANTSVEKETEELRK